MSSLSATARGSAIRSGGHLAEFGVIAPVGREGLYRLIGIIDDGAEGYLSQRLDRYGKPVCSGVGAPGTTVGKFKNWIPDPI